MNDNHTFQARLDRYVVWLGRICGAVSLFSLIAKAFNIGLAEALVPLVHAWRTFVHYTIGWLLKFFNLPAIWGDLFVISSITIFIFYRGALRIGVKPMRMGFDGFVNVYVARRVRQCKDDLEDTLIYKDSTVATIHQVARERVSNTDARKMTLLERQQHLRRLTREEVAEISESFGSDVRYSLENNAGRTISAVVSTAPILFGGFVLSGFFLQLIGPFVDDPGRYNYNILEIALRATFYVPVIVYFFGPLAVWLIFLLAYGIQVAWRVNQTNAPLGSFPQLIFDETVLLVVSVLVFFLANAGFSLF